MEVCQSSAFENSYSGLPSLLRNCRAGSGCPWLLAKKSLKKMESFFQNAGGAPGGKQGLRWAGGLAEPCPGPEMPLSRDTVCYTDVWVPVCRLLGLGQVWFLFGLVALMYLCPQHRHSSLPPAPRSVRSALSWRFSLLGFPAPSGNWFKATPQLFVEFLKRGGLSVTKQARAALLWKRAAKLVKPVFSRFLLQRGSLESRWCELWGFPWSGHAPWGFFAI